MIYQLFSTGVWHEPTKSRKQQLKYENILESKIDSLSLETPPIFKMNKNLIQPVANFSQILRFKLQQFNLINISQQVRTGIAYSC